jgi:hypothetical protein
MSIVVCAECDECGKMEKIGQGEGWERNKESIGGGHYKMMHYCGDCK